MNALAKSSVLSHNPPLVSGETRRHKCLKKIIKYWFFSTISSIFGRHTVQTLPTSDTKIISFLLVRRQWGEPEFWYRLNMALWSSPTLLSKQKVLLGEKKNYSQAKTHIVLPKNIGCNLMIFSVSFIFLHFDGPSKDPWRKLQEVGRWSLSWYFSCFSQINWPKSAWNHIFPQVSPFRLHCR